jgi:hypothetical protein
MSLLFFPPGHDPQRPDWLAGAPGLEPGNGGIKIQAVRVIYQCAFRKMAEIQPQPAQEVRRYFGMPEWKSRISPRGASCPPKAEVTSSNLVGRARKFFRHNTLEPRRFRLSSRMSAECPRNLFGACSSRFMHQRRWSRSAAQDAAQRPETTEAAHTLKQAPRQRCAGTGAGAAHRLRMMLAEHAAINRSAPVESNQTTF